MQTSLGVKMRLLVLGTWSLATVMYLGGCLAAALVGSASSSAIDKAGRSQIDASCRKDVARFVRSNQVPRTPAARSFDGKWKCIYMLPNDNAEYSDVTVEEWLTLSVTNSTATMAGQQRDRYNGDTPVLRKATVGGSKLLVAGKETVEAIAVEVDPKGRVMTGKFIGYNEVRAVCPKVDFQCTRR